MKYKKNLVSIALVTWFPNQNKEKYIKWTLDSLNECTNKNFELLIINNETKESDKEFLKKHTKQFKNNKFCKGVKIIYNKENRGWTGAWDQSIKSSYGEYFAIINDDLIFSQDWLKKLLKHFREDIGAAGPVSNFVAGIQDIHHSIPGVYEERVNFLIGFCLLFRRKALDSIREGKNYVDPRFFPGGSDEIDACIKLRKVGWDLLLARDVFISHFGSKSLECLQEFQQNPNEFYLKRHQLLIDKHGKEAVDALTEFQRCPKFVIGIPTIGKIDFFFMSAYGPFLERCWKTFGFDSVVPMIAPRNLPHIARNEIVRKAILYGAEYLMFLDDDMVFPENTLIRLLGHNKDYVSALAYQRIVPFDPCIYTTRGANGGILSDYRLKQGLIEVDATGLACCLIKMSVIKRVIRQVSMKNKNSSGLFRFTRFGEDFNFCSDLKKIGIKLYADTDLIIDHLGNEQRVNHITHLSYQRNKLGIVK